MSARAPGSIELQDGRDLRHRPAGHLHHGGIGLAAGIGRLLDPAHLLDIDDFHFAPRLSAASGIAIRQAISSMLPITGISRNR